MRDRRLGGFKFRRQQPLGGYTLDFFCAEALLCIELDSVYHEGAAKQRRDAARDAKIAEMGIQTLRFTASALAREKDAVLATILREASARTADNGTRRGPSAPSPAGRRCLAEPDG